MLSLHAQGLLLLAAVLLSRSKSVNLSGMFFFKTPTKNVILSAAPHRFIA
jgi:hypothetical protein